MTITMGPLQGQAMLDALFSLDQYSLHASPPFQDKEEWMAMVRERKGVTCHAVLEDDMPLSIAASTAMTQNMRGQLYPASGIWGVATFPAARRKGYCRQTIASLLAAERTSGKVFSNLYPFRESFYENMGYVSFPLAKIAKFAPPALAPLLNLETGGEIDLHPIGASYDLYREYLTEMRLYTHGMAIFDFGDQASANRNTLWLAQAWFGDALEGLLLYRIQGDEPTKFNFVGMRFYYQTSRARYLLLNWIARHIDQADRAELWLAPTEYPETWLADIQPNMESPARAGMSRVLDVEKIGGMQVGEGRFTARIVDPLCPWNEGIWQFESHAGVLQVAKGSSTDCELTIQGLTGLVAGTLDPQDLPLRGWGNPSPAVQAIQRAIFPHVIPHMHEVF